MSQLEKITIRVAEVCDLPTMFKLWDDVLGDTSEEDELKQRLERWSARLGKDAPFLFYIAENDDQKMVGWCSGRPALQDNREVGNQTYDCEIGHLFILQQYQHRGIGRELWKIVWNAVLLRFHPSSFTVWSLNKEQAHQFYLSLGGTPAGTKKSEDTILTAYVWHGLKPHDSTHFLMFK